MAGLEGAIGPAIEIYVSGMHAAAVGLALMVPLFRLGFKKFVGVHYGANEAVHDGISAAALPSLFAMMMVLLSTTVISHINTFEFFAAGLLGIIQTIAQLFSASSHGGNNAVKH